jgi:hypothetical protein
MRLEASLITQWFEGDYECEGTCILELVEFNAAH